MSLPAQYQGGNVLSYLIGATIDDSVQTLIGKTLSRPALKGTDGLNQYWVCDVAISGQKYPLRDVPVAQGNRQLAYADTGAAVTLTRTGAGTFQITGFATTMPGTFIQYPVDLGSFTTGTPVNVGLRTYVLTLGDLMDPTFGAGFGMVAFGAYALYQGTTLIRVQV